jgi:hypothetical protein
VLWYVEGTFADSDYWTNVFTTIVDSFTFTNDDTTASSGSEAVEEPVDEEEVIE